MCAASMIGDHYRDKWMQPGWPGGAGPTAPFRTFTLPSPVTQEAFDKLKADVEEMKALLKRAVKYDADNGEPACEMDEKMDLLRRVAKLVGVSLDDVIAPQSSSQA